MTVTDPIVTKLTLASQTCVSNYNTEFHENPTNSGVTYTKSKKERKKDKQMWLSH